MVGARESEAERGRRDGGDETLSHGPFRTACTVLTLRIQSMYCIQHRLHVRARDAHAHIVARRTALRIMSMSLAADRETIVSLAMNIVHPRGCCNSSIQMTPLYCDACADGP